MLFNSLHYLLFFPSAVLVFFLLPFRFRNLFLLLASYYFYMVWNPYYIFLILISTAVDYFAALGIEKSENQSRKRILLLASLATNLGLLFAFKYFNFLAGSVSEIFSLFNPDPGMRPVPRLNVLLPVGISFYTFQTLSYSIDVYRGNKEAERNIVDFALYVSFFPQLVAGPIERSTRLLPQLKATKQFDVQRMLDGGKLMLLGFFKKVVIADRAALLVDTVYGSPTGFSGIQLIVATLLFAFQIYGDFSGYTDIAIGSAKVLGFDLMANFKQPYFSRRMSEFWSRWHISLSSWFRDYVYIPLGGNRQGQARTLANLTIVFFLSGLWHGANWTFAAWGLLHAAYVVSERVMVRHGLIREKPQGGISNALSLIVTFALVNVGWVFFRAASIQDALYILGHVFVDFRLDNLVSEFSGLGLTKFNMALLLSSLVVLILIDLASWNGDLVQRVKRLPTPLRWSFYYFLLAAPLFLGVFGDESQFIYFQF